jgi:hypothetical protein
LRDQRPLQTETTFNRQDIGLVAAFGLAIFVVLWLRRPDSLLNPQFWAEDGVFFFQQQLLHGFWKSLFGPYSGYLHVVPRLITGLISLLPVRWAPLGSNVGTLLLEAVSCSAFFWPGYRQIIASDALRATCCLAMAAAPAAGLELIATLCNVQWYLSVLSLLLIVATTRHAARKATEIWLSIAQVCIALTSPVTLLYIPFLLWQLKNKPGWLKIRPLLHMAALLLQGWMMRHYATAKPVLRFNVLFLATLSSGISRCVLEPMIGPTFLKASPESLFTKMLLALLLGVILATLLAVRLGGLQRMKWVLSAAYVGIGSLLAVLSGRGVAKEFVWLQGIVGYTAERYFFIGACMFIFCLAFAIDTFTRRMNPRIAVGLLVCCFTLGTIRNYSAQSLVDFNWPDSAAKIERWEAARKSHGRVKSVSVPVNPAGWSLTLDGDN